MRAVVFLILCLVLPAVTVALTLGLHRIDPGPGMTRR